MKKNEKLLIGVLTFKVCFCVFCLLWLMGEHAATYRSLDKARKLNKEKDTKIVTLETALDLCEEENQILGSVIANQNGY